MSSLPSPPTPIRTLSDLAALYRSSYPTSASFLPSPATAATAAETHLPLLVQQRTLALLRLQAALSRLESGRPEWAKEVDKLRREVEEEVRLESPFTELPGGKERKAQTEEAKKVRERRVKTQKKVEGGYHALVSSFEREWGEADTLFRRWEVVLSLAPGGSHGERADRLASWLGGLDGGRGGRSGTEAVEDFLSLLLKEDPYILGSGIAMLSDLTALLSPASSPSSSSHPSPFHSRSETPLQILFSFLSSASPSPTAVLELARGICETAVRELVGRERGAGRGGGVSQPSTPLEEEGLEEIGLGINMSRSDGGDGGETRGMHGRTRRGAREKELEELLVAVLDGLDRLGVATDGGEAGSTPGPLAFTTRPMEDLLLSFLSVGSSLLSTTSPSFASSTTSRSPSSPAPSSPPSSPSATWSPSTFLSHSLSTLASTPHLAYKTVTSVASLPGTAFNAFGLPTPPLSSLPSPASPKVPSSPESPNKPLPRIPPRSRAPTPSPSQEETPLNAFLTSTGASLLRLLTPSPSSSHLPRPLADQLLHDLLSSSFPPVSSTIGASASTQEEEHRKILSVGMVRWWAFQRLGAFLRSPQTAPAPSLFRNSGVVLPDQPNTPLPPPPVAGSRCASSFLSSVPITSATETALLLPLYRVVYQAVTTACGLSGGERGRGQEGKGEGRMQETKGQRELRSAAEDFVEGWRTGECASSQADGATGEEAEKEKPRTVKVVHFFPSTLQALFTSTAGVLFPELVPSSLRRGGVGARGSFKRGSSFGLGQDGWVEKGADEGEDRGTTLRERVEEVLDAASSTEEAVVLVCVTGTAGQGGAGRDKVVSLTPPLPPSPPFPPALPPPSCLSPSEYFALRRALHTLLSTSSYTHICTSSSSASNDLLVALSSACSLALSRGEYAHHALFSRATTTLSRLSPLDRSEVFASLFSSLSAPLLAAQTRSSALIALSTSSLSALATQHAVFLSAGREALSRLEQARRRAWVAEVTASPLGKQLRARLREVGEGSRTEEEKQLAAEEVERWKEDIGALFGFIPPDSQRDEGLMLVELASALATELGALAESGLFAREAAVWALAAGEGGQARGEGQEEGRGFASTILGTPAALLGNNPLPPSPFAHLSPLHTPATASFSPSTSSSAQTGEVDAAISANLMEGRAVFDPQLGATTASLAADEGIGGGTGEAYLTDLASFLASSLLANLSSPSSSPDGALVTLCSSARTYTDGLLSLLLSPPTSPPDPLLPLDPRSGRPRVLTPTGPAPPAYVGALLRRFVEHPDLREKFAVLVEVEKVLVELLEAGLSSDGGEGVTAAVRKDEGGAQRLSFTTGDGGHLGPPLPDDVPFSGAYGSLRSSLRQRRKRVSTSPSGLALQRLWSHTSASATSTATEPTSCLPSPLRADFVAGRASSPPLLPLALGGKGGTWRRHRRGVSLPSAASGASDGTGSPPPSPADLPSRPPALGAGGEGVSTDALLGALENAILHFLPSLLPPTLPCPSPASPATTFSSPPTDTPAYTPTCGLFTTLHLLAHLSPSLSSHTFSASSNALEAKAFSDLAVACLAIKGDLLDAKNGVVESAWAALGEGTEEGKEKARRLGEIAAREDAAGAKDLLVALG